MTERYVVTTKSGEPIIRTDDKATAERFCKTLNGMIIDNEQDKDKN